MHETFSVPIARLAALHSQTDLKFFEVANCPESGWFGPARLPRCVPRNHHCTLPLSVTRTIPFGITEPPFAFMGFAYRSPISSSCLPVHPGAPEMCHRATSKAAIHGVAFSQSAHLACGFGLHTGFSRIYTPGQMWGNPAFEHVVKRVSRTPWSRGFGASDRGPSGTPVWGSERFPVLVFVGREAFPRNRGKARQWCPACGRHDSGHERWAGQGIRPVLKR